MSTTRPTDIPDWASAPPSPADDIKEPGASKQALGWVFQEPPPYNLTNWFWNRVAQWAQHVADVSSRFETPEAAIEATAGAPFPVDGTCIVKGDEAFIPGAVHTVDAGGLGASAQVIAVTGRSIVVQFGDPDGGPGTGDIKVFRRDGSGTEISTIALASASTPRILSDGVHVAFPTSSSINLHLHDLGTNVYTLSLGAGTINDIAWDDDQIYVVSDFLGGQLRAIDRATGVINWSFDHNAVLQSVAVHGDRVFVAGTASAHASGATLRSVRASDGFDATGEGGNGTDALQWDFVQGTLTTLPRCLAADGRGLYVGQGAFVTLRSPATGGGLGTIGSFAQDIRSIDIDHEKVFISTSDRVFGGGGTGGLHVLDRDTLVESWTYIDPTIERVHNTASDGHAVFVAQEISTNVLPRLYRGTRTGWWQRIDPDSAAYRVIGALRQLLIPITRA